MRSAKAHLAHYIDMLSRGVIEEMEPEKLWRNPAALEIAWHQSSRQSDIYLGIKRAALMYGKAMLSVINVTGNTIGEIESAGEAASNRRNLARKRQRVSQAIIAFFIGAYAKYAAWPSE